MTELHIVLYQFIFLVAFWQIWFTASCLFFFCLFFFCYCLVLPVGVSVSPRTQMPVVTSRCKGRNWPQFFFSWLTVEVTEITRECFNAGSWNVPTCLTYSHTSLFLPVNSVSLTTRCTSKIPLHVLYSHAASCNCYHAELVLMCIFFLCCCCCCRVGSLAEPSWIWGTREHEGWELMRTRCIINCQTSCD